MRYVDRDESGRIIADYALPQYPGHEGLPNDHPDWLPTPEEVIAAKLAAIEARYAPKFAALQARLLTVILADGADQTAKTAAIQLKNQALVDAQVAEIDAVLMGGM